MARKATPDEIAVIQKSLDRFGINRFKVQPTRVLRMTGSGWKVEPWYTHEMKMNPGNFALRINSETQ